MSTILGFSAECFKKDEMWRLFIDKSHHIEATRAVTDATVLRSEKTITSPGYAYDALKSPGHHDSMMKALYEYVFSITTEPKPDPLDFSQYNAIHAFLAENGNSIVKKARKKRESGDWTYGFGSPPLTDKALKELLSKKIGGRPLIGERKDLMGGRRVRFKIGTSLKPSNCLCAYFPKENKRDYKIETNYNIATESQKFSNAIFTDHYEQMAEAKTDSKKIEIIADTVRSVHVCHFFADGNGRTNMPIVMNRLLCEQGFLPSILPHDPKVFGGIKTKKELAKDIKDGMKEFIEKCITPDASERPKELNERISKIEVLCESLELEGTAKRGNKPPRPGRFQRIFGRK